MLFNRLRADVTVISFFSRDVINILKRKIAEPLSFQLSLVIEHPKYISFEDFQPDTNLRFSSITF